MNEISPFHLAIPVDNLEKNRKFYRDILGCEEGRNSDHWVDFNFFGHQLVIHLQEKKIAHSPVSNAVDGKEVPIPHFGVVLHWNDFQDFAVHLKKQQVVFRIAPFIRFKGKTGEQMTLFFYDPSGNALEFKAFKNSNQIFKK